MKNIRKYNDEQVMARAIKNFLPKPEDLVLKEKKTKVTLSLTKRTIRFFKGVAKKQNASYQAMIRRLLDYYAISH